MAGKIAKKHFLGQGTPRLGCAQAVAEALREPLGLDDALVHSMVSARGGQAPLGYCGAVYAAMRVAEEKALNKKQEIEDYFKKEAGGVTCHDIRSRRQLMCADCVEKAANLLVGDINNKK
jgi:hypothetical protein